MKKIVLTLGVALVLAGLGWQGYPNLANAQVGFSINVGPAQPAQPYCDPYYANCSYYNYYSAPYAEPYNQYFYYSSPPVYEEPHWRGHERGHERRVEPRHEPRKEHRGGEEHHPG
jgi:hypothetical protein